MLSSRFTHLLMQRMSCSIISGPLPLLTIIHRLSMSMWPHCIIPVSVWNAVKRRQGHEQGQTSSNHGPRCSSSAARSSSRSFLPAAASSSAARTRRSSTRLSAVSCATAPWCFTAFFAARSAAALASSAASCSLHHSISVAVCGI